MPKRDDKIRTTTSKRVVSNKPVLNKLFLALTLVPMVVGLLLIIAWVLDWEIWQPISSQPVVGFLFILISFALSNAIQHSWLLTGGWGLLALADFIVLSWLNLAAQIMAGVIALVGLVLLGVEFYRRWQATAQKK